MTYEAVTDILEQFPMVETLIVDIQMEDGGYVDQIIDKIRKDFDSLGPFYCAKKHGVLVNESGEEFAIQWMSFYNMHRMASFY